MNLLEEIIKENNQSKLKPVIAKVFQVSEPLKKENLHWDFLKIGKLYLPFLPLHSSFVKQ